METLNKKALVDILADKIGITKVSATTAVEVVFEEIINAVAAGNKVDIAGFGKFEITERAARQGVNPATGERIPIAASKAPKFKAAKAFKDSVK